MGSFPTLAPPVILIMYKLPARNSFSSPASVRKLVGVGARPVEAQGGVGVELADDAVAGGAEGDGKDEANGEELDGDLLERTDALGDGVRWEALLVVVVLGARLLHDGEYVPECSSFCEDVSI